MTMTSETASLILDIHYFLYVKWKLEVTIKMFLSLMTQKKKKKNVTSINI